MSMLHEEMLAEIDKDNRQKNYIPEYVAVEKELSLAWAKNNPYLCVIAIEKFQNNYPTELWNHSIDMSREGFIILKANLK